ncbi:MAG TPA: shikimate dehydrogenase [Magnetospirillaceae bacterium]|jgi:shikimate dehydrogenase
MTLTGKARIAGVLGWPVGHSRSPKLHGFWLAQHRIDGAYIPLPVAPEHFERAVRTLPQLGFAGANVTVPHKEAALRLADTVDDVAKRIGAANTLVFGTDGKISATNTDAFGFIENLRHSASGFVATKGPAVVLGAGGSARAIVAALIDDGAPEIRLVNRTLERAQDLAAHLGGPVKPVAWSERAEALRGAALLVNTTTQGMTGHPPLDLALDALPVTALVNDIVYVPLITDLLARAAARGNPTVDGLGMLLHQARPGFAAWFGVMPQVTLDLRKAVEAG